MSQDQLPRFFRVRQSFPRPRVDDVPGAVRAELGRVFPPGSLRAGMEIGVTVGSRGIRGIAEITRAAVDFFKRHQVKPFILPAMGSHGGAEGEEQRDLIAEYGVTEEAMGVPVRYAMETKSLGKTDSGVEVFLAKTAWDADGVLLLNRIKPHTDFKGRIESGLAKICAIGLGKLDGAREYHSHIFDIGLGEAILQASGRILESGKVLGGLGVLENAYHETARLGGVTVSGFFDQEAALLDEARGLMGRLPFDQFDVLVCDRIGKNISGAGLDTNIIGRGVYGYIAGEPWMEGMPSITRIAVLDLSDESHGNGTGMGLVDFATERFYGKVDLRVTRINSVTACAPGGAKTPVILLSDRDAIATAIRTTQRRPEGPRVAYIRDTMGLEELCLSEALLADARAASGLEVLSEPAPLPFDDAGSLASPFATE